VLSIYLLLMLMILGFSRFRARQSAQHFRGVNALSAFNLDPACGYRTNLRQRRTARTSSTPIHLVIHRYKTFAFRRRPVRDEELAQLKERHMIGTMIHLVLYADGSESRPAQTGSTPNKLHLGWSLGRCRR
jgi:hypothetical protein